MCVLLGEKTSDRGTCRAVHVKVAALVSCYYVAAMSAWQESHVHRPAGVDAAALVEMQHLKHLEV